MRLALGRFGVVCFVGLERGLRTGLGNTLEVAMTDSQLSLTQPSPSDWISRFMGQFSGPHGWLGHVAGLLMARMNRPANTWIVEQLGVAPDSRVLEVGFGPGVATSLLAERCSFVAGIDKSAVMLQQAQRRNRQAIERGRVDLRRGSAEFLPFAEASFTHAFAVNSFQFWPDAGAGLRELARVLEPNGALLLAQRMRQEGVSRTDRRRFGMSEETLAQVRAQLSNAGFEVCGSDQRLIRDETIVALRARRLACQAAPGAALLADNEGLACNNTLGSTH